MNKHLSLALVVWTVACGQSHPSSPALDTGVAADSSAVDSSAVDSSVPSADTGADSGGPSRPPGSFGCGDELCTEDELCCYVTLSCFDPVNPADCPTPARDEDPEACGSAADCETWEYCRNPDGLCNGVGTCEEVYCGPVDGANGICGCDGNNYATACEANRRGVRVSSTGRFGACGRVSLPGGRTDCTEDRHCRVGYACDVEESACVFGNPLIACGIDTHCPGGMECCPLSSTCYDPVACPACCQQPPPGTFLPCGTDGDCEAFESGAYCFGEGCADEGGGCAFPVAEEGTCSGAFTPVCGCDGITYTNACWARAERQRIASDSMCP